MRKDGNLNSKIIGIPLCPDIKIIISIFDAEMKISKTLLTLILTIFTLLIVKGQPNYSLKSHDITEGKTARLSNKAAKKSFKKGAYNEGLIHVAQALKRAEKKKHLSKAQNFLISHYSNAINKNLQKITALQKKSISFSGDQTVTQRADILHIYRIMNQYCGILNDLHPRRFKAVKKRDTDVVIQIETYENQINASKILFDESLQLAAKMHYEKGIRLAKNNQKKDNKEAAKHFKWASEYIPNYRDANKKYFDLRKLAVTRMGFATFKSGGNFSQMGDLIVNSVLKIFIAHANQFEFFEVLDRTQMNALMLEHGMRESEIMDPSDTPNFGNLLGADVLCVGSIDRADVDRQMAQPYLQEFTEKVIIGEEKYLNNNGKERTRSIKDNVSATAQLNQKFSIAVLSATYKIFDVATGALLDMGEVSGKYEWNYVWMSSFQGDKRAIPDEMPVNEIRFPTQDEMMQPANEFTAKELYKSISNYVRKTFE